MKMSHQLIAVAVGSLMILGSATAAPRLTIKETKFNFGYLPQNARVSHAYWLKSTGDDTLRITKVTPGCGCTKAPLEKESLAPGDSARLEIIFSSGQYSGHVVKRPKIQTNEGTPDQFIEFTCNVVMKPDSTYPVAIKPYKLDLSQFGETRRETMTFHINNVSESPVELTLIAAPEDFLSVELPKSIAPGQSAEATISLTEEAAEKEFEKSFTFEVNDPARSRFTVPVKRSLNYSGQPPKTISDVKPAGDH